MITSGIAMSMQVTSTPWIRSRTCPVGSRWPVFDPAASRKARRIGAAVPGTPSMAVLPS